MIDPFGFLSFLRGLIHDLGKVQVIVIDPLSAINNEPTFQHLTSKGHTIRWARSERLRVFSRDGWRRVVARDLMGRRHVFMDRRKELILISKPR
jgi:hypothetical protein